MEARHTDSKLPIEMQARDICTAKDVMRQEKREKEGAGLRSGEGCPELVS